jgi:hypothetical protein
MAATQPATASASTASDMLPLMAVPRMRASNEKTDGELAHMLSEILTVEARKVQGVQVLSMSDIEATLGYEQQKQLLGCDDTSCMAELGGAMGCRLILSSKVGRVGDTYVLALSVIDTQSVKVVSSTYDTVEGKPDALITRIRSAVPGLLDPVVHTDAPKIVQASAAPAKTGSGSELVLNWPAIGVAGLGVAMLVGTGVVATLGFFEGQNVGEPTEIAGGTMYEPGSEHSTVQSQVLGYVALGLGLTGLAAVAGGVGWQVLAQGGEP